MAQAEPAEPAQIEEVAHLALQTGRLLLLNGAGTAHVEAAVTRFASAFGCETNVVVGYEALLLTIVAGGHFRTKIGHRVPAMGVGLTAVAALDALLAEAGAGRLSLPQARAALAAIERREPDYPRWLVILSLGLTAASLSRLFGGDWPCFAVAWLAGAAGTWLRQELGRRRANPVAIPFAASCAGGIIGGVAVLAGVSATPSLCLIAPAMILVPGVPLINAMQDMLGNHMTLGIGRLGFASLITTAIACGLFVAMAITGAAIPVVEPARSVAPAEDALFSALAALGYVALFNVPARMAWACLACGVASHTLRTLCGGLGIGIVTATLAGALAAGILAQVFARRFQAPAVAFAFPGVVAMVPGAYAFRAVLGSLQIAGGTADPALLSATFALGITVVLMIGAIAIGIAAPVLIFGPRPPRHDAAPQAREGGGTRRDASRS